MGCDMLVRLYDIPDDAVWELEKKLRDSGIYLKRAMTADMSRVLDFVRGAFSQGWADQAEAGILSNGCWIAVKDKKVVGFACFDATLPDFFGPTGVLEEMRGLGVGRALLLKCMLSMKERGYAYAIIGWAGPTGFYKKCVGAV